MACNNVIIIIIKSGFQSVQNRKEPSCLKKLNVNMSAQCTRTTLLKLIGRSRGQSGSTGWRRVTAWLAAEGWCHRRNLPDRLHWSAAAHVAVTSHPPPLQRHWLHVVTPSRGPVQNLPEPSRSPVQNPPEARSRTLQKPGPEPSRTLQKPGPEPSRSPVQNLPEPSRSPVQCEQRTSAGIRHLACE